MVNVNTFVLTMMDHMNVHATLDMRLEMMASPVKVSKNFKIIILYNNHCIPLPSPFQSIHAFTLSFSLLLCSPSPCLHALPPPVFMLSLPSHSPSPSFHALPLPSFILSLLLSFETSFLLFRCKRMCFGEWRM